MKFAILHDTGLLGHIMPELDVLFRTDGSRAGSGGHTAFCRGGERRVALGVLLHETGVDAGPAKEPGDCRRILRRLKFDNKSRNRILRITKASGHGDQA